MSKDKSSDVSAFRGREPSFGSNVHGSSIGASAVGPNASAVGITIINQGLSLAETERYFGLLFEKNFPRMAEGPREEARQRVDDFATTFKRVAGAQRVTEEQAAAFAEPDVQYTVNSAIHSAARKDSQDLRETLSRLLIRRLTGADDDMKSIIYDEAVMVVGKLTSRQLRILALCFRIKHMPWDMPASTWPLFNGVVDRTVRPLLPTKASPADFSHIEYTGCGAIDQGRALSLANVWRSGSSHLFDAAEFQQVLAHASPVGTEVSDVWNDEFSALTLRSVGIAIGLTIYEQITGEKLSDDAWLT